MTLLDNPFDDEDTQLVYHLPCVQPHFCVVSREHSPLLPGDETREAAELSPPESESNITTSVPDFEITETLRKQVQQSSKDDYWSR